MPFIFLSFLFLVSLQSINAEIIQTMVCEEETLSLHCPRGYAINILSSFYGKVNPRYCNLPGDEISNCTAGNALHIMKFKCNRKQDCQVDARNAVFQDPCKGTRKYLEVMYECNRVNISTEISCEHSNLELKCPHGQYLWIVNAMYGRADPLTCYRADMNIRTVHCDGVNSREAVEIRCNNLQECIIPATNEVFGDPCLGTYKYLEVDYQCTDEFVQQRLVCEDETINIDCPRGYVINILTALYGKKNHKYCNTPGKFTDNCAARTSLEIVKLKCNRKQVCKLAASNTVFQDPCVGTRKYLEVSYECLRDEINTKVACEDDTLNIKCPQGQSIWIVDAMYGRTDLLTCYHPEKEIRTIHCSASESTNIVESRCDNRQHCSTPATNEIFGDPCAWNYKYLQIDYQCLDRA